MLLLVNFHDLYNKKIIFNDLFAKKGNTLLIFDNNFIDVIFFQLKLLVEN